MYRNPDQYTVTAHAIPRRGLHVRAIAIGMFAALAMFTFIAPRAFAQTPTATATATPTTSTELAPIDGLEIKLVGTNPVQYEAIVTSGLPSGCATFDSIAMVRNGNRFDIVVQNKMSVPAGGACTTIYGSVTNKVNLGTDYTAETTYTVVANAAGSRPMTKTFVAFIAGSSATPSATATAVATGTPVAPRPANTGNAGLHEANSTLLVRVLGGSALAFAAVAAFLVRVPRRSR